MTTSIILIIICILLSAFFSGSEIAYASVNKLRLKNNSESKTDELSLKLAEDYEDTLSGILLGNNLVNIAASSATTVLAMKITGSEDGIVLATFIITLVLIIFGEIAPKILGRKRSLRVCELTSYPLKGFMIITYPMVYIMKLILKVVSKLWPESEKEEMSKDELSTVIDMVVDEGVIDEDQGELIQSAIEFADTSCQEILTPRVDLTSIDIDDNYEEIVSVIENCPYSRIPVYEDTIDNIIGILYVNGFYRQALESEKVDIRSILMSVVYVPKTVKLDDVMNTLKEHKQHLAVVNDEYGGTLGIVTMEDILEELVGDIWDENEEVENDVEMIDENTLRIDADMSIYDFLEEVGIDEDDFEGDYTTVGGFVMENLNDFAQVGDQFKYRNVTIKVTEVEDRRVLSVEATIDVENEEE